MHVFLTGEIQKGKSTAIKKCLHELENTIVRGFFTVSGPEDENGFRPVYIIPADEKPPVYSDDRICLIRKGFRRGIESFPEIFDKLGVKYLESAEKADLIIMDEVGRAEADAELFNARIEKLLDGNVPILGVCQLMSHTPLSEKLRHHPKVRLIVLTEENRDNLPPVILEALRIPFDA